ncbi:MAG TPA: helix-turn-helix domain-containing protein, partial [Methylophilaceae bacterium]|nr:helix-turn-helix domain-containing protein [Methylophilaceae bacterium]
SQLMLTGRCHRMHTPEQQLCRWLLCSLDLFQTTQLKTSAELIAEVLGLETLKVASVLEQLQADGLIIIDKAHIHILDRPGLKREVCDCYREIKLETEKWSPHTFDRRKTPRPR